MSSRRLPSLLEKEFGEHYTITLSEFHNNVYAHIKNANGRGEGKRVSLHLSALQELGRILPEVLRVGETHKRTNQEHEGEETPPQKRARQDGIHQ